MDFENEMKEEEPKEKKYHRNCTICLSKENTADKKIQSHDDNNFVRDTESGVNRTSASNYLQSSDSEVTFEEENHLDSSDHSSSTTVSAKSELQSVEQEEEIIEEELSDDSACSNSEIPQYEDIGCDSNRVEFGLCRAETPEGFQKPLLDSSEVSLKLLELEKKHFETEREYMLKKLENKRELLELKKRKLMIRMEMHQLKKFKYVI
ncbi:uncharacterized protein [Leptinotarsa decemlineata]|uniref:uncharacterized protein n=1 Tax=Leptinotarsa decemlineata TaxID=7539 RepID=UPI003D30B0FD